MQLVAAPDVGPLLGREGRGGRHFLIDMGSMGHRRVLREPIVVRFMDHPSLLDPICGTSEPSAVYGPGENVRKIEAEMTTGLADDSFQACGCR
jgi:hypothetical protein